jgi:hypothetical protein
MNKDIIWPLTIESWLEGVSDDIYLGIAVRKTLREIGISEYVFVDNHNSELQRQSI